MELNGETKFESVETLQQMELEPGTAFGLEAYVLYTPPELALRKVLNRMTKKEDHVFVLSVLLADRTGPITLEYWRQDAEKAHALLQKWENFFSPFCNMLQMLLRDASCAWMNGGCVEC